MELLIPFFQKLKENLHHYGIEQCLLIDHHPIWRNTTTAVINVGNNGLSQKPNGAAKSDGGSDAVPTEDSGANRSKEPP